MSRRVSALAAKAHAVLDAAAVSGAEFELAVVAEVVGLGVDANLEVLDAAVKAGLIGEVPDEPGRYAFVHAIVRDTLARGATNTLGPQRSSSATCNATANCSTPPTGTNAGTNSCTPPPRRRGQSGSTGPPALGRAKAAEPFRRRFGSM